MESNHATSRLTQIPIVCNVFFKSCVYKLFNSQINICNHSLHKTNGSFLCHIGHLPKWSSFFPALLIRADGGIEVHATRWTSSNVTFKWEFKFVLGKADATRCAAKFNFNDKSSFVFVSAHTKLFQTQNASIDGLCVCVFRCCCAVLWHRRLSMFTLKLWVSRNNRTNIMRKTNQL